MPPNELFSKPSKCRTNFGQTTLGGWLFLLPLVFQLCLGHGSLQAADLPRFTNSLGMTFVRIGPGEFAMGTPEVESRLMLARMQRERVHEWYQQSPRSESPPRRVRISKPFFLGVHEVTLRDFRAFVSATNYRTDAERDRLGAAGQRNGKWLEQAAEFNWREMGFDRADNEPVVNVSWNDAVAFCAWLSRREGARYRLPTEAEWEFACRAGSTNTFFWGADEQQLDQFGWHGRNSGGRPHPVGQLKSNPWGLYDIVGNAYEYCADGWSTNLATDLRPTRPLSAGESESLLIDPFAPSDGNEIVVRGASWGTHPMHLRPAFRGDAAKDHRNQRDGFRVALDAP